ncbi:hypothetical protein F2P79_002188 [Pimephales promelas]|nr:hypothetical protein F2P79_002188 [Pimephales promelas]
MGRLPHITVSPAHQRGKWKRGLAVKTNLSVCKNCCSVSTTAGAAAPEDQHTRPFQGVSSVLRSRSLLLNNHGFTREPVPVVGPGAGGGPGEAVRWKQTQLRVQEEETQLTL